jgi:hypothetical protein
VFIRGLLGAIMKRGPCTSCIRSNEAVMRDYVEYVDFPYGVMLQLNSDSKPQVG